MTILYHYCSAESFISIISSRKIRLSSLTLSNDSQEGTLMLDRLRECAREGNLDSHVLSNLEEYLRLAYESFEGLGFCLSEEADLLSQWRGYADDGQGVSIGFNHEALEKIARQLPNSDQAVFKLSKIVYAQNTQIELAKKFFRDISPLLDQGAFSAIDSTTSSVLFPKSQEQKVSIQDATSTAAKKLFLTMSQMFDIKNSAFEEEFEWRLIHLSMKSKDAPYLKFRSSVNKIIPYIEIDFPEIIEKIVLGPKHKTPKHIIEQLLHQNKFNNVEVVRSSATYQ